MREDGVIRARKHEHSGIRNQARHLFDFREPGDEHLRIRGYVLDRVDLKKSSVQLLFYVQRFIFEKELVFAARFLHEGDQAVHESRGKEHAAHDLVFAPHVEDLFELDVFQFDPMAVRRPTHEEIGNGSNGGSYDESGQKRAGKSSEELDRDALVSQCDQRPDRGGNGERQHLDDSGVRHVARDTHGFRYLEFGLGIFPSEKETVVRGNASAVFSRTPHFGRTQFESVDLDGLSVFRVGEFEAVFFRVDAVPSREKPLRNEVGEFEPVFAPRGKFRILRDKA